MTVEVDSVLQEGNLGGPTYFTTAGLGDQPHPQGGIRPGIAPAGPARDDQSIKAYKHEPEVVFRRLCAAPNPTTYWKDRIAEEYPKGTPMSAGAGPGKKWSDLFGGGDEP